MQAHLSARHKEPMHVALQDEGIHSNKKIFDAKRIFLNTPHKNRALRGLGIEEICGVVVCGHLRSLLL